MGSRERLEAEFIQISWKLIEYKIMYYCTDKFTTKFLNKHLPKDVIYDEMETKYVRLCKLLKKPNTVQSMVGIDLDRPSVQLALAKLEEKGSSTKRVRRFRKNQFTEMSNSLSCIKGDSHAN